MRKSIEDDCHMELRQILNNLTFVGAIDRCQALIQHETSLYLCDTRQLG